MKKARKIHDGKVIPFIITKEQFLIAAKNALSSHLYQRVCDESLPSLIKTTIQTHIDADDTTMLLSKDAFTQQAHETHDHKYCYSQIAPIVPMPFEQDELWDQTV